MGIDYTCKLIYGFEFDQDDVHAIFQKSKKEEGSFHMEDRFDPKTGAKVKQEKVWDKKPHTETWYEINGETFKYLDMEEWDALLEKMLGCHVDTVGSFPSGELSYVFYVNKPVNWKDADDYGHVTVFNNVISQAELTELMPKALALKCSLEKLGLEPGEPQVFIATRIS